MGRGGVGQAFEVAVGAAVDLVELADPLEGAFCLWVIRRGFLEFAVDVRPARSEPNAGPFARPRLVVSELVKPRKSEAAARRS